MDEIVFCIVLLLCGWNCIVDMWMELYFVLYCCYVDGIVFCIVLLLCGWNCVLYCIVIMWMELYFVLYFIFVPVNTEFFVPQASSPFMGIADDWWDVLAACYVLSSGDHCSAGLPLHHLPYFAIGASLMM